MIAMQESKFNNPDNNPKVPKDFTTIATSSSLSNGEQFAIFQGLIEHLIDGILIVSDQKELIYANESARRILRQLNQDKRSPNLVPNEIWHICQFLMGSRSLFPNQYWVLESNIFTNESTALHIRVRWLKVEKIQHPCILITVENLYQGIKNIAIEEADKYGMTRREKEVWLLHRDRFTYKQIASELFITPNTVKKHMRSIHAKQKDAFEMRE
jgi:DNA-binding CsgD family transcriptional regulator